ncbi:hypothetical protein ACFLY4_05755 [Chloroflexota bacterium]
MPDQKEFRKNKRKQGAQPGNLNAFKHGFYSKLFEPLDREDIENLLSMDLEEEIVMLRKATQHTFGLAYQVDDIDQAIKSLGALGLASIRTSRLLKSQKELGNGDQALSALTNAINQVLREWGRI